MDDLNRYIDDNSRRKLIYKILDVEENEIAKVLIVPYWADTSMGQTLRNIGIPKEYMVRVREGLERKELNTLQEIINFIINTDK